MMDFLKKTAEAFLVAAMVLALVYAPQVVNFAGELLHKIIVGM